DIVRDAVILAHWESQGFKNEQYVDLWDFCGRLALQCDKISPAPKKLKDACEAVQKIIAGEPGKPGIVVHSCYTGAAFQHSHGISVFFPWANMTDAVGTSDLTVYKQLAFAKQTKWDEFLNTYLARSQRQVRFGNREVPPDTEGLEKSRLNRRPD